MNHLYINFVLYKNNIRIWLNGYKEKYKILKLVALLKSIFLAYYLFVPCESYLIKTLTKKKKLDT